MDLQLDLGSSMSETVWKLFRRKQGGGSLRSVVL